jgi:hypothetical protein
MRHPHKQSTDADSQRSIPLIRTLTLQFGTTAYRPWRVIGRRTVSRVSLCSFIYTDSLNVWPLFALAPVRCHFTVQLVEPSIPAALSKNRLGLGR